MQNIDISEFLVANNIKTEEELLTQAQEQFAKGKKDLKKFILSKSPKPQQDLVTTTWRIKEVVTNIRRQKKHGMEIIGKTLEKERVEECCGNWYRCVIEVLQGNNMERVAFAVA